MRDNSQYQAKTPVTGTQLTLIMRWLWGKACAQRSAIQIL